jgi:ABC-type phosphate/phosphonate transport system permease subunit
MVTKFQWKLTLKDKYFFWLIVLKISVHDQMSPILWTPGKAAYHVKSTWQIKPPRVPQSISRACSTNLRISYKALLPKVFTTSQLHHPGDQVLNTKTFAGHQNQRIFLILDLQLISFFGQNLSWKLLVNLALLLRGKLRKENWIEIPIRLLNL